MASPKRKRPAVVRIAGEKRVANDREKKFAREYLKCFNFYKAAKSRRLCRNNSPAHCIHDFFSSVGTGVCRRIAGKIRIRRYRRS